MKRDTVLVACAGLTLVAGAFAFHSAGAPTAAISPQQASIATACGNCASAQSANAATLPFAVHANTQRKAAGDFDGDGKSDLLLGHEPNSWVAYWTMNGPLPATYSEVFALPPSQGWLPATYQRVGTDDFNADGRADLLLFHPSNGFVIWLANGAGGFSERPVSVDVYPYTVIGTGDVDADGDADMLVSDSSDGSFGYWILDGGAVVRKTTGFPRPDGSPALVATGDFNGDHRVDLLWKPAGSRSLVMSLGDGQGFTAAPVRDYAAGWEVWGAGDVDADGRSDIVLVNPSSRFLAYWTMDGATPARYSQVFRLPGGAELPSRFGPVAAGDYNGDGRLDMVFSRQRDRALVMWLGDGTSFTEYPVRSHAQDWQIARSFTTAGAPVQPYVDQDVNGDGRSDVVAGFLDFRNPEPLAWSPYAEYHVTLPRPAWYGDDYKTFRQYSTTFLFTGGQPLATGDFDGDGRLDMVAARQNSTTGARETVVALSSLDGDAPVAIPSPLAPWEMIGSGDIDGDGLSDLLLGQNLPAVTAGSDAYNRPSMEGLAYWIMERGNVLRYSLGFRTDPAAPRLAAKGDFNGDGKLDLVWSSLPGAEAPQLRMWLGDGSGFAVSTLQAPAAGWNVIAAGDIDADGRSDLVLRNGEGAAFWLMDAMRIREYSPGFLIRGTDRVADFTGDGRADLLYLASSGSPSVTRYATIFESDGRGFPRSWTAGAIYGSGRVLTAVPYAFTR